MRGLSVFEFVSIFLVGRHIDAAPGWAISTQDTTRPGGPRA